MNIVTCKHLYALSFIVALVIGIFFFNCLQLNWMLAFYVAGAVTVGIAVFIGEYEPSFTIKNKKQRLGPSYWGVYQGSELHDANEEQRIEPPKPCKDIEGLAGSGAYAGGKAIKGARS